LGGGCVGVAWGLEGINLSNPPRNPQEILNQPPLNIKQK